MLCLRYIMVYSTASRRFRMFFERNMWEIAEYVMFADKSMDRGSSAREGASKQSPSEPDDRVTRSHLSRLGFRSVYFAQQTSCSCIRRFSKARYDGTEGACQEMVTHATPAQLCHRHIPHGPIPVCNTHISSCGMYMRACASEWTTTSSRFTESRICNVLEPYALLQPLATAMKAQFWRTPHVGTAVYLKRTGETLLAVLMRHSHVDTILPHITRRMAMRTYPMEVVRSVVSPFVRPAT